MRPRVRKIMDFLFGQNHMHVADTTTAHHLMGGGSGAPPQPGGLTPEAQAAITRNTLKGVAKEWDEWVASL